MERHLQQQPFIVDLSHMSERLRTISRTLRDVARRELGFLFLSSPLWSYGARFSLRHHATYYDRRRSILHILGVLPFGSDERTTEAFC